MLEKLGFVLAILVLAGMKMVSMSQTATAIPDAILHALFRSRIPEDIQRRSRTSEG